MGMGVELREITSYLMQNRYYKLKLIQVGRIMKNTLTEFAVKGNCYLKQVFLQAR